MPTRPPGSPPEDRRRRLGVGAQHVLEGARGRRELARPGGIRPPRYPPSRKTMGSFKRHPEPHARRQRLGRRRAAYRRNDVDAVGRSHPPSAPEPPRMRVVVERHDGLDAEPREPRDPRRARARARPRRTRPAAARCGCARARSGTRWRRPTAAARSRRASARGGRTPAAPLVADLQAPGRSHSVQSFSGAPSIWYEEVATPQRKEGGHLSSLRQGMQKAGRRRACLAAGLPADHVSSVAWCFTSLASAM